MEEGGQINVSVLFVYLLVCFPVSVEGRGMGLLSAVKLHQHPQMGGGYLLHRHWQLRRPKDAQSRYTHPNHYTYVVVFPKDGFESSGLLEESHRTSCMGLSHT